LAASRQLRGKDYRVGVGRPCACNHQLNFTNGVRQIRERPSQLALRGLSQGTLVKLICGRCAFAFIDHGPSSFAGSRHRKNADQGLHIGAASEDGDSQGMQHVQRTNQDLCLGAGLR
jgi:hypothetical protein